jgi:hypothetical protein
MLKKDQLWDDTMTHLSEIKKSLDDMNLPREILTETYHLMERPDAIKKRSEDLYIATKNRLKSFLGEAKNVLISWSGGKDTSNLYIAIKKLFPQIHVNLVTVLNGYDQNHEAPRQQYINIKDHFRFSDSTHYYVQLTDIYKKHVINSAYDDLKILHAPAICSSCKSLISLAMAFIAIKLNSTHVVEGYIKTQADQSWTDQSPKQRFLTKSFVESKFNLKIGEPLYKHMTLPIDPSLLGYALDKPIKLQKKQMVCAAYNMMPKKLYNKNIENLVSKKLEDIYKDMRDLEISNDIPKDYMPIFIQNVNTLRKDRKVYMANAFKPENYNEFLILMSQHIDGIT